MCSTPVMFTYAFLVWYFRANLVFALSQASSCVSADTVITSLDCVPFCRVQFFNALHSSVPPFD